MARDMKEFLDINVIELWYVKTMECCSHSLLTLSLIPPCAIHHTISSSRWCSMQDGTRQTVSDLLVKYPSLTSRVVLGNYRTAELGQRLSALVITKQQSNSNNTNNATAGSGRRKGKLLVVSSIHARELTTAETSKLVVESCFLLLQTHRCNRDEQKRKLNFFILLLPCCKVTRFAEYLLQNYGVDPDVTWILDCECDKVARCAHLKERTPQSLKNDVISAFLLMSFTLVILLALAPTDMEIHLILHGRSTSSLR